MPDPTHIEPPLLARATQKYGLSKEQVTTLIRHFCAQTPFAEVHAAMQVDMDIINRIFALRWQDALTDLPGEQVGRSHASEPASAMAAAPVTINKPSSELVDMARQLLALRIDRESIRSYLRADMPTWRGIMKSIDEG